MGSRMHQLLAALDSVAGKYQAMKSETMAVFGKPNLLMRTLSEKKFFDENDTKLNARELSEITTTVPDRMSYFFESVSSYYDISLQRDLTNQVAKADVIMADGTVFAKDVPGTFLLGAEKKLSDLRDVLLKAPTLPPGLPWRYDPDERLHVTSEPEVSFSTKKNIRPIIMVPATEKFQAQFEKISEDIPVAKIEKTIWSGMLTSAQKSDMLGRLDVLLIAVKKARMAANDCEVVTGAIGKKVTDFILGDVVKLAS